MRTKARPDEVSLGEVLKDHDDSERWAHGEGLLDQVQLWPWGLFSYI